MKYSLVICVFLATLVKGQTKSRFDCDLLQSVIETEVIKEQFHLCEMKKILIVDTNNYFDGCTLDKICDKKVELIHVLPADIKINKIVVLSLKKIKKTYQLNFYCPKNGGTIFFTLKKRKHCIKVTKHELGAF